MNAVSGRPSCVVVDGGAVPRDQAALLEPLHPLVHGRGGQPGGLAEVGEGHPAVGGEQLEDPAVGVLHVATGVTRGQGSGSSRGGSACRTAPRDRPPDAARHRLAVLPRVLRRARRITAPERHAGQRRARAARLHQPAGRRVPARPTWSAAGTTTGARSGGSTCSRRTRRTGSSTSQPGDAPDVEEVPDPLEVQVPIIRDVLDGVRDRAWSAPTATRPTT